MNIDLISQQNELLKNCEMELTLPVSHYPFDFEKRRTNQLPLDIVICRSLIHSINVQYPTFFAISIRSDSIILNRFSF
jgi:hypothetical protein